MTLSETHIYVLAREFQALPQTSVVGHNVAIGWHPLHIPGDWVIITVAISCSNAQSDVDLNGYPKTNSLFHPFRDTSLWGVHPQLEVISRIAAAILLASTFLPCLSQLAEGDLGLEL